MQITISLPTGPFTFEVQSTEKISDVATRLEQKMGSPQGTAVLLLNQQSLEQDKTIGDYDIQEGTSVELIIPQVCLF